MGKRNGCICNGKAVTQLVFGSDGYRTRTLNGGRGCLVVEGGVHAYAKALLGLPVSCIQLYKKKVCSIWKRWWDEES